MFWCTKRKRQSPMEDTTSRIFVKDMVLEMAIGAFDSEKGVTQRVRVNVTADLNHWPDEDRDDLEDTLSYSNIVRHIRDIAAKGHIHLVETFASRIADACLAEKNVSRITVRVEKLEIYDFCVPGCEIVRSK